MMEITIPSLVEFAQFVNPNDTLEALQVEAGDGIHRVAEEAER